MYRVINTAYSNMFYLLRSDKHTVFLCLKKKQIISWFIKLKTCFINEYFIGF